MKWKNDLRRIDPAMAEKVQYGISLLYVADRLQAQRYLANFGVPNEVIARVLSAAPARRRIYGTHLTCDLESDRLHPKSEVIEPNPPR